MFDKKGFRQQMADRIAQEKEREKKSFKNVFKVEVPIFKEKKGDTILDVIPYHAGSMDPDVKEGNWAFRLPLFVHKNVGVNEEVFLCLNSMYNKPCPICEHRKKLKDAGVPGKKYKKYFPQRRSLFNVWVQHDQKEMDKGVQVWDISNYLGWDKIYPHTKDRRTGKDIYFMEPTMEEGQSIVFTREELGDNKVSYTGHGLLKRDYNVPEKIQKGVYKLDELLYVPKYDEVSDAFYSVVDEDVNVEQNTSSKNTSDDGDATREQSESRFSRARSNEVGQETAKDEQSIEHPVDNQQRTAEKREDSSPERVSRVQRARTREETPVDQCPENYNFGIDYDLFEECKKCNIWESCQNIYLKMEEERKNKQSINRVRRS